MRPVHLHYWYVSPTWRCFFTLLAGWCLITRVPVGRWKSQRRRRAWQEIFLRNAFAFLVRSYTHRYAISCLDHWRTDKPTIGQRVVPEIKQSEIVHPVGKMAKNSLKEWVFVNSALKIQCHIVKNTLLQTAFSAILPIGWEL